MGAAALTPDTKSAILLPAGYQGPAFLVFDKFNAVMEYNNAHTYAMSICLLADRIKGEPGILGSWPQSDPPLLSNADRMELQRLLSAKVENVGEADGVIGRKTRAAVRAFQKLAGRIPDGYATQSLLVALRKHKS
jgi:membrane-bound lytic murein transglycosylase B